MVSMNPNPVQAQAFYADPSRMPFPGLNPLPAVGPPSSAVAAAAAAAEDTGTKVRKSYTITKSRESWTEQEHDKFLEALQLFDRDWKKIEAFVGSKTVIQIRSHAQKYFLKVEKNGSNEHVPPPRPKRKAAHPYPQKASRNVPSSRTVGSYQAMRTAHEPGYLYSSDLPSALTDQPACSVAPSSWTYGSVTAAGPMKVKKDNAIMEAPALVPPSSGCCYSGSESTPSTLPTGGAFDQSNLMEPIKVMPDFGQVYRFIGSVFEPDSHDHLQRLKQMDPINMETALLLMRNLSVNLSSSEFEDQRKMLSSNDVETGKVRSCSPVVPTADKNNSKTVIAAI